MRKSKTFSRWSRSSYTLIGRKTPPDILERDLKKYINWYNNVRIKRRLGGSSPGECRLSQPIDSLLLPFRKRGPLQKKGCSQI